MNDMLKCSFHNCSKHHNNRTKCDSLSHFGINDLSIEDLKEVKYEDPFYRARRPLEPERLKSLYQSAFIYNLLYNFAKEHLEPDKKNTKIENVCLAKDAATDTQVDLIKDKVIEYLFKYETRQTVNEKEVLKFKTDENYEQLWNSEDIKDLRKVFTHVKDENMLLRSKIIAVEEENVQLKEKYDNLKTETKFLPHEKSTLEKENKRLYILIQEMENEIVNLKTEIVAFEKENKILRDSLDDEKKMHQNVANEKCQLEFKNRKYENFVKNVKNEYRLKRNAIIDEIKLKFEKELNLLNKKLKDVTEEFSLEKEQHERTQNALKHLRTHFLCDILPEKSSKLSDNQIKII